MSQAAASSRDDPEDELFVPEARGVSDALGDRLEGRRPLVAGLTVWAIGYAILAVVLVGLGWLLTTILLPAGMGRFDLDVSRWFVAQRTATLNAATEVGGNLGSTGVILGVALVTIVALAIGRHWRHIGFLVAALTLEFSVFLTSTFAIDRNRPPVTRLDPSPVTSSYPSGHAAASLVLYVGIAIVITSFVRSFALRVLAWVVAIGLGSFVAVSRVYRGMHHFTDVSASVLLAAGALTFALLATRAAVAASGERSDHLTETERWPYPEETP